jgi:hypothetical protein
MHKAMDPVGVIAQQIQVREILRETEEGMNFMNLR